MHTCRMEPSRYSKISVSLIALAILLSNLTLSPVAQAADPVGELKFTRGTVTIESTTGESRRVRKGDDLIQNELVVTGAASIAVIQLNDDSRMILRSNSEFRVEELNDSAGSQQSAVLNLLRGGLRLVTGLISKANPAAYRLRTPVATIGIRGTEFNSRICADDCSAEEGELAGSDAAENIEQGLYVNVDEGRIFLDNDAAVDPLDLDQGESGYVAGLNSAPVKLALVPAFLSLDRLPSPSQLDFNNIEIPDDAFQAFNSEAQVAGAASTPSTGEVSSEVELSGTYAGFDVSGTYEIDVTYGSDLPTSDRRRFWGASPDIEFALTQDGDKMSGEFSGDLEGTIKGVVDDDQVTFEFLLEARGGETKSGYGSWTIQDDGSLKGEFNIKDHRLGVVRGRWTLTRVESSGGTAFEFDILFLLLVFSLIAHRARVNRRKPRSPI